MRHGGHQHRQGAARRRVARGLEVQHGAVRTRLRERGLHARRGLRRPAQGGCAPCEHGLADCRRLLRRGQEPDPGQRQEGRPRLRRVLEGHRVLSPGHACMHAWADVHGVSLLEVEGVALALVRRARGVRRRRLPSLQSLGVTSGARHRRMLGGRLAAGSRGLASLSARQHPRVLHGGRGAQALVHVLADHLPQDVAQAAAHGLPRGSVQVEAALDGLPHGGRGVAVGAGEGHLLAEREVEHNAGAEDVDLEVVLRSEANLGRDVAG
mmetsp:Transcript_43927/g.136731  ORF Transcript_43927/g.136731 Transcript_43927/m.136731 type:complete len:267 (+) Transcript_43927:229-1029(+)